MKIVYIAHPIAGDVQGNLKAIGEIIRVINLNEPDCIPFAPYVSDLLSMKDDVPAERSRGMRNNQEYFLRKIMDELWIFGKKLSEGVRKEIIWSIQAGIPIVVHHGNGANFTEVVNFIFNHGYELKYFDIVKAIYVPSQSAGLISPDHE